MSLGKKRMGRSATDPSTNPLSTKTLNRKEPKKCGVGVGVQGAGNPTLPERKEETDTWKSRPQGTTDSGTGDSSLAPRRAASANGRAPQTPPPLPACRSGGIGSGTSTKTLRSESLTQQQRPDDRAHRPGSGDSRATAQPRSPRRSPGSMHRARGHPAQPRPPNTKARTARAPAAQAPRRGRGSPGTAAGSRRRRPPRRAPGSRTAAAPAPAAARPGAAAPPRSRRRSGAPARPHRPPSSQPAPSRTHLGHVITQCHVRRGHVPGALARLGARTKAGGAGLRRTEASAAVARAAALAAEELEAGAECAAGACPALRAHPRTPPGNIISRCRGPTKETTGSEQNEVQFPFWKTLAANTRKV